MSEKSYIKMEIRIIANYQALITSKYYINIMLILISLYLGFLRYNLPSMYILIVLNILPYAFAAGIKDYAEKTGARILTALSSDRPFQLSSLKNGYKYTKLKYVSNSITYIITLILISLWQVRNNHDLYLRDNLKNLPSLVLLTGLSLRLLCIFYYRFKIQYDLTHNRI